jgi:hypothetical protein
MRTLPPQMSDTERQQLDRSAQVLRDAVQGAGV